MLNQPTIDKLHTLRLFGFADELARQEEQRQEYVNLSFEERLAFLIEQEWLVRENKRLSQLLRRAKLRQAACLEDIDYTQPRAGLDRGTMRQLARCNWIREKQNLLITGRTGVGKSYIACALVNQACREGHTALYTRLPRLLAEIDLARTDGSYPRLVRRLGKVGVLVLDDWGLAPLGQMERLALLDILDERQDTGSVIAASQLPVKAWHALIGDQTIADAIMDRLIPESIRLEIDGDSMRSTRQKLRKEEGAE